MGTQDDVVAEAMTERVGMHKRLQTAISAIEKLAGDCAEVTAWAQSQRAMWDDEMKTPVYLLTQPQFQALAVVIRKLHPALHMRFLAIEDYARAARKMPRP